MEKKSSAGMNITNSTVVFEGTNAFSGTLKWNPSLVKDEK